MCFQGRAISSRHLIYIHFCISLGFFVNRWWLKEVWYAPVLLVCFFLLSNCSTRVPLATAGITRSPSKRICRGTPSQKPETDPPSMISRYMHMNAAERGGGASTRPTLSTTRLSMSLALGARRLDAHGQLGSTLSPLRKRHTPRRPRFSLNLLALRCQPRKQSVRSSSFAKKKKKEKTNEEEVPCV